MITIDLRGKAPEEVAALVRENGVGEGDIADVTHLYPGLDQKYEKVVIVWLITGSCTASKPAILEPTIPVHYVLWDGKSYPYRSGDDLHGFVRPDGGIDWGKAHTMNLMR